MHLTQKMQHQLPTPKSNYTLSKISNLLSLDLNEFSKVSMAFTFWGNIKKYVEEIWWSIKRHLMHFHCKVSKFLHTICSVPGLEIIFKLFSVPSYIIHRPSLSSQLSRQSGPFCAKSSKDPPNSVVG